MGLLALATLARGNGLDTGNRADRLATSPDAVALGGAEWLRIRGIFEPAAPEERNKVDETRQALIDLRAAGRRTCVFLRWDGITWNKVQNSQRLQALGNFPTPTIHLDNATTRDRGQLPLDLRMAYARCRALAETYGEAVDAWEIDNEPDLGFVPENAEHYAAFLKACWLGFKAGSSKPDRSPTSWNLSLQTSNLPRAPLVVMAPMGLPPGPWFERFVANDGLSYTDGFNFHYYGYAEDFTGVYRTFEEAVTNTGQLDRHGALRASRDDKAGEKGEDGDDQPLASSGERLAPSSQQLAPDSQPSSLSSQLRHLPIFATEIGYGMLGMRERDTKAARLRQWRWFKMVGEQVAQLGIEAPMAFYLQRYHEPTGLEFGLSVPHTSPRKFDLYRRGGWYSGGNYFVPSDFNAERTEEWMREIGRKTAAGDMSPALAWWLNAPRSQKSAARAWVARVTEPSPVVIDLLAGKGLVAEHRYNGYFVRGLGPHAEGRAEVVLYNFSDAPVRGQLQLPECFAGERSIDIELAPLERRVVEVRVVVDGTTFHANDVEISFRSASVAPARFITTFYSQFAGRAVAKTQPLTPEKVATSPYREGLLRRPLATEEVPKRVQNFCLVQPGATVSWTADGFAVDVSSVPPGKERRIEVEIPWPAEWNFGDEQLLRLDYRAARLADRAKEWPPHDEFYVQVRTENGNVYGVVPMRSLREKWEAYWEPRRNFTLWFYGRANLPWEFAKNKPVSLRLVLFPVAVPARYEFRRVGLVTLAPSLEPRN